MIDKPDDSAMTMENILLPHRNRTIQRMKGQDAVLCIQDGSDLNYSHLTTCEGLGVIGKNQTGATSKGLHLHSTFVTTDDGLPLGILRAECTAPKIQEKKGGKKPSDIPIEEKKNYCWINSVRDCETLKAQMSQTTLINVMDREGDFFEMFDDWRFHSQNVELLVRAQYNRNTTGKDKLFDAARNSPSQTRLRVVVPRQSARPKRSKQKARKSRPKRTAEVSVHYRSIELKPPRTPVNKGKNGSVRISQTQFWCDFQRYK
jgi:hypothetical protein